LYFSGPQYDKYAASLFYIGRRIYKIIDIKGRWMAKLVARLLAMAAFWVRNHAEQTYLKNYKMGDICRQMEWPTDSSPPKNYTKKNI
jgi:hypothetical protein